MDNEQDKLLDDLIGYYDSPDDAMGGDTAVIPQIQKEAPREEILGDTLVVDIKPQSTEETTVVNIPEPKMPEIPQDEVFGNLDIEGNVIPLRPRAENRRNIDTPAPTQSRKKQDAIPPTRKRGIWYSLKPLWATIIVCIMLVFSYLFFITDTGIVGIYKSNFSYNFSLLMRVFGIEYNPLKGIPIIGDSSVFGITARAEGETAYTSYDTIDEIKASVPFAEADTASFHRYKNGVVCVKSNYICYITHNGEKEWEQETQISNPILSVSGKYIAVAGKDSTHLNLYKGKDLVYSIDTANKIKTCSVSEKGDVALVTNKASYKGGVTVYNKKGEEVFSWISGVNYITSAQMLKSRNVAVSLISTENAVKSYVMAFDIYKPDPINGSEIADSLIFGSSGYKNDAYICADNAISSVNSDGELNYLIRFDDMEIFHTAIDKRGWRAVSYISDNLPYINVYNRKGSLYSTSATESIPDYLDVYKSTILYNNGRDVLCGEADDIKSWYSAPMTVKNLIMINRHTYMVVYENSLEIIKK